MWTTAASLPSPAPPLLHITHAHPQPAASECYAHNREYQRDFLTDRLFTGPLKIPPPPPLCPVSVPAFYAAKASLICPQKGETQQLLLLIVCMSTCILLPCGGYCNRVVAAGGFSPSFCQPSCSPGPSVILVSFVPPTSHTLRFILVLVLGITVALS